MELGDTVLFRGINTSDCGRMRSCFEIRQTHFGPGERIIEYGSGTSEVGLVLSGSVLTLRYTMNGERVLMEHILAGGIFGESLAFASSSDEISVICQDEAEIIFIDKKHIVKRCSNACDCHSSLVQNFIEALSERSVRLSERVEVLSNRSIRDKLLCYFNLLSSSEKSRSFTLPFSLSSLADFLCVNRSAMAREMSRMEDEGIISQNRRSIRLL